MYRPLVWVAVVRCCLSCGYRNTGAHGDCAQCGILLSRPCPSCAADMKNGASMCLVCVEIDNSHMAQPRKQDNLALQPWAPPVLSAAASAGFTAEEDSSGGRDAEEGIPPSN